MVKTTQSSHFIKTLAFAAGGLFVAASLQGEPRAVERVVAERVSSTHHDFRVVQLAGDLVHPWAVAWMPDGSMLITERAGRLLHFDGSAFQEISGLPVLHSDNNQLPAPRGGRQGGLLDLVLHPDYASNGWIYFTFSSPGDRDAVVTDDRRGTGTALARARLDAENHRLADLQVLYSQEPRSAPGRHYGSRIVFPGDGTVFFSIGDNGLRYTSQDLTHPAGSIIRLLEDGGAAPNNPFIGVAPGNLRPEIYSFGHRNNQGLAIDPATGSIWATDHGPRGGDLLYRIQRGANFGWPQVSFGTEYTTDAFIGIGRSAPGVTPPAHVWEESKGPSGLTFYRGDAFPAWRGHLFAGFLLSESVHRIALDGDTVVEEEPLLEGLIGRIRDVREGPDGFLYFLTDEGDGGLFRIEPLSR